MGNKTAQLAISFLVALLVIGGVYYGFKVMKDKEKGITEENQEAELTEPEEFAGDVLLKTNFGDITIELFSDKAPKTTSNFTTLAEQDFYDGTRFHRIMKGFMIQGGDPFSKDKATVSKWGTGGPGYTFEDEINDELIVRGVIAMANAGPDTNGSQFFIVTASAASWLDGKHTVFGRVVGGMDVVDKIESIPTVEETALPLEDVVVLDVLVKK